MGQLDQVLWIALYSPALGVAHQVDNVTRRERRNPLLPCAARPLLEALAILIFIRRLRDGAAALPAWVPRMVYRRPTMATQRFGFVGVIPAAGLYIRRNQRRPLAEAGPLPYDAVRGEGEPPASVSKRSVSSRAWVMGTKGDHEGVGSRLPSGHIPGTPARAGGRCRAARQGRAASRRAPS